MSLFQGLSDDGLEQAQDRLGGFQPFNTDIYPAKIKAAYAGKAPSGAMSVTIMADIAGKEYRETVYITNKAGENFFYNKQDAKKKVPLPGFTTINDICLITCEKPLSQMDTEEKIIKLYDYDAKQEVPKPVQMLVELIGKDVALGIFRQLENKSVKDGAGKYVATPETREVNLIEKVFHPELKLTVVEAQNGKKLGEFWDSWVERNKDTIRDKREIKDGAGGTAGAPKTAPTSGATATQAPKKSLFSK
jgi:hypothetical protein